MNITIDENTKSVLETALLVIAIIAFYYFMFKFDRE